ncbi:MAG TPA: tetratricopeptide repeat protein [Acidobacteriota bacterium]
MISWPSVLGGLLLALSPSQTDASLQTAHLQFDTGKYSEAARTLRTALSQAPQDARLHYWLARCYYELGDFDNSVNSAERAVGIDPPNSEYHLWLGRAYGGKAEKAHSFSLARKVRREFEEAVRLNPSNVTARRDLIEFYVEAPWIVGGDKDKARRQAEAILALDAVEGHLAMAAYWLSEKKPDRAESEYLQAVDLKPTRPEPYWEFADFYQKRNQADRMEQVVERAARVNPSDPRLAYYRGVVRVLAGNRLTEAEKFLKTYLETFPRSDFPSQAAAREWLGRLYERQGRRND